MTTLYLVDPVGGRYRVARLPAPSYYGLLDWSGDGRRALIEVPPPGNRGAPEIEDLDLATGTVLHRFAGSADAGYQYTKPDGLAVLASSPPVDNGQGSVVRLGLSGSVELRYPTSFPGAGPLVPTLGGAGGVLPTLNGLELVVQLRDTMVLIANNGAFIRVVGPRRLGCSPDRWWDPDDLLASCQVPGPSSDGGTALWVVPIDGKAAYQLTYPAPPDLGDLDGWEVGTTVYTQAAGPCASEFLARRLPNGHMTAVAVPGSQGDVHVVGAHGSRLALQAVLGCGAGRTLFWFNPATSQEAPLLGAPLNGGSVLAVIPYPGLEP